MSRRAADMISPQEAMKLIDLLQEQARRSPNDRIRQILLTAGCQIADLVLESESPSEAAAAA